MVIRNNSAGKQCQWARPMAVKTALNFDGAVSENNGIRSFTPSKAFI